MLLYGVEAWTLLITDAAVLKPHIVGLQIIKSRPKPVENLAVYTLVSPIISLAASPKPILNIAFRDALDAIGSHVNFDYLISSRSRR